MMKSVETEVIKSLQITEYTLNTVNSYGENMLHISAAYSCLDITKEILRKQESCQVIDRKNKFGWTPLMLAIRNRDINTVKYLLEMNANVNESTYLGMSVLGLAAAVSKDMFEIVYKKCPSALLNSMTDDITPLCIAAMKNDKNLFFRLIELGFDISKSNEYTHIMMSQSTVPEIKNLAKHLDIEDYWNDTSDNILVENEKGEMDHLHRWKPIKEDKGIFSRKIMQNMQKYDSTNNSNILISPVNISIKPIFSFELAESCTDDCNNNIITDAKLYLESDTQNLTVKQLKSALHSSISPTLTESFNTILPASPNIYFTQNEHVDKLTSDVMLDAEDMQMKQANSEMVKTGFNKNKMSTELPLQRLQCIRPPDLDIQNEDEDLNSTLGFMPEFSPQRSPNIPSDINDENAFGEHTPTPPRCKTPPRGMILNSEEAKMLVLLKRYGLSQHVSTFLEQEVDIDLFMTLTDTDLIEIGIKNEIDRKAILNVIIDYKQSIA